MKRTNDRSTKGYVSSEVDVSSYSKMVKINYAGNLFETFLKLLDLDVIRFKNRG